MVINHDPLCEYTPNSYNDIVWCAGGNPCSCEFIARIRADERWATIESAVFVASQYGCDDGLINALNAIRGES